MGGDDVGDGVDGGGGEEGGGDDQGSRKSLAALALLADKLKSHGHIIIKSTYILSKFRTENARKGICHRQRFL